MAGVRAESRLLLRFAQRSAVWTNRTCAGAANAHAAFVVEAAVQSYNLGGFQTDLSPRHVRAHTSRTFRTFGLSARMRAGGAYLISMQRRATRSKANRRSELILSVRVFAHSVDELRQLDRR